MSPADLDALIARAEIADASILRVAMITGDELAEVADALRSRRATARLLGDIDRLDAELVRITVDADAGAEILEAVWGRADYIDQHDEENYPRRASAHRVLADVLDALAARTDRLADIDDEEGST